MPAFKCVMLAFKHQTLLFSTPNFIKQLLLFKMPKKWYLYCPNRHFKCQNKRLLNLQKSSVLIAKKVAFKMLKMAFKFYEMDTGLNMRQNNLNPAVIFYKQISIGKISSA